MSILQFAAPLKSSEEFEDHRANKVVADFLNLKSNNMNLHCEKHPDITNVINIKGYGTRYETVAVCCSDYENIVRQYLERLP